MRPEALAEISEQWLSIDADKVSSDTPSPIDNLNDFEFMPTGCEYETTNVTDPENCGYPYTTRCGTVNPCVGTGHVCGC